MPGSPLEKDEEAAEQRAKRGLAEFLWFFLMHPKVLAALLLAVGGGFVYRESTRGKEIQQKAEAQAQDVYWTEDGIRKIFREEGAKLFREEGPKLIAPSEAGIRAILDNSDSKTQIAGFKAMDRARRQAEQ